MRLDLRTHGVALTDDLRDHVEKRVHFALGRFGDRVREVRVSLTDLNGPRGGGDDIRCSIHARLAPSSSMLVEQRSADPFAAVARASDRVARGMRRHVNRAHAQRRRRA
jgi:ribosomal subunit interface protein